MTLGFSSYIRLFEKDFSEFCTARLNPLGLSGGLLYFLLYIGKHAGCTPSDLSSALRADSGHAARCIAKLEQLSYLERKRSEQDKRVTELFLTQEGKKAFSAVQGLFSEWENMVLEPLSAQERLTLHTLMQRIVPKLSFVCAKPHGLEAASSDASTRNLPPSCGL